MTELVARKTIELAKQGERDAVKLCAALLKTFTDGGADPGTSEPRGVGLRSDR